MRLGILNGELGIAAIDSLDDLGHIQTEQIKKQMPEGANLSDLAFSYIPNRDWIVINKSHELYWFYSDIIPIYLKLSEESRKVCMEKAPNETIKKAYEILEEVILRRQLIDGVAPVQQEGKEDIVHKNQNII